MGAVKRNHNHVTVCPKLEGAGRKHLEVVEGRRHQWHIAWPLAVSREQSQLHCSHYLPHANDYSLIC